MSKGGCGLAGTRPYLRGRHVDVSAFFLLYYEPPGLLVPWVILYARLYGMPNSLLMLLMLCPSLSDCCTNF